VVSTDASAKPELHVLHVGTNAVDSVHDEHWYGQPTNHHQHALTSWTAVGSGVARNWREGAQNHMKIICLVYNDT